MRLESVIQAKVRQMCDNISACKDRGQVIQIRHALTAAIVDITTEYCTSPFQCRQELKMYSYQRTCC